MQWFDVDKAGLAKILARRGKEFIIYELVQNTWDENTQKVSINLLRIPNTRNVRITVEDDNPTGFSNLSHAFTLFAESAKKSDAKKRGRFNLGEKLVLALCEEASIISTTGSVHFDKKGRRAMRSKTETGSKFTGILRMTNEEIDRCNEMVKQLLPPAHIFTEYNGVVIPSRVPVKLAVASLPTEIADSEGYLKKSAQKADLEIFDVLPGETAKIYEMGIPVVETGDRWHVNVPIKVPLNMDRDNVTPSYLATIRAAVLEHMTDELNVADATSTWVKDAIQHFGPKFDKETIGKVVSLRFSNKRVSYDPSDPEANNIAVAAGYTVVHGGHLSAAEWDAVRRIEAILPAGRVTPSPKPFSPDGEPLKLLPPDQWTRPMEMTIAYIQRICDKLIDIPIRIEIANDIEWPFKATYGKGRLIFNLGRLGHKWFGGSLVAINQLVIHELGHHYSGNHLSTEYHEALCTLGAKMTQLAIESPGSFTVDMLAPE